MKHSPRKGTFILKLIDYGEQLFYLIKKKRALRRVFACLLAEQNMLHHKPPKFPKDKPIKHLGFKSAF